MGKSPQNNESSRETRRKEILDAAISLFARSGFSRTALSDIARAAGIAHGTVFLYFPSKEELFRAALLEPLVDFELLLSANSEGEQDRGANADPLQLIRALVERHVSIFSSRIDYLRLTQYVAGQPERFPDLVAALDDFTRRFCAQLAPLIERGQKSSRFAPGDPKIIALSYFSYLNGLGLTILGDPPDSPIWAKLAEQGVRLFGPVEP
jgi:AcrR family transcriptional regulator